MAKGKKYKKWLENHSRTLEVGPNEIYSQNKALHLVHGFFLYECENCDAVYEMYLDKGLEDKVQDRKNPKAHKPVPFVIGCRECRTGMCRHILFGIGDSDEYEELPDGASYFENRPEYDCGRAVIRQSFRDRKHWLKNRIERYGMKEEG